MEPKKSSLGGEYLTFTLDSEEYGIGLLHVREIIEHQPITLVPNAPASLRGVINLRGAVVPVVDLAARFGLGACVIGRFTCTIIVDLVIDGEVTLLGLLVDSVDDVLTFAASDIVPPPTFGTRVRYDHLLGLGRRDAKFIVLLDATKVLAIDELLSIANARASVSPDASAPREEAP
jgi:purine-binding chemotaxis protein CheW